MGVQKQKGNLDSLLTLLDNDDYGTISGKFPKLVKPIDELVSTRKLK
jgi:hypothetical protein